MGKGYMRTKILLVFPPYTREALSDYPPLGILYIASYILNENPNLDVRIIDFTVEKFSSKWWREELDVFKPEVVGISVLTLNYLGGRLIAQLTRKFDPSILIVMGGVHAEAEVDECLDYCDIVVHGEGEVTFREIIQGKPLDAIKGISYWKDGRIIHNEKREPIPNLDDLPFPAHHLLKMQKYKAFPAWGVMASRGCPYDCIFCCSPQMWGRIVRFRSPANIIDEIEYLHDKFGVRHITFFDDTINILQKRAIELCDNITKRSLHKKMSFSCQMRANRQFVSMELFRRMKEANFVRVDFGIESGSERILKSMRKSLTLKEAREAVRLARKAGIDRVTGFFMVGNWDETVWDIFKTWKFVFSANMELSFSICTPFPGTGFYQRLKERGYVSDAFNWDDFTATTPVVRTNKMSRLSIFTAYIVSILLQLFFAVTRGGEPVHTLSRIMAHALDRSTVKSLKQ